MRVLVTGANGFVGHHLCRRLLGNGVRVSALIHQGQERLPEVTSLLTLTGDVRDADGMVASLTGHDPVDAIAHLATQPPGAGPRCGTNEQRTTNVLLAARGAGVGRVVFTSTMSVFDFLHDEPQPPLDEDHPPDPRDAYGAEKLAAEHRCRAEEGGGLCVPILLLAGLFGPGKRAGAVYNFRRSALLDEEIIIAADRRVDLLWVEDAVSAVVEALSPEGPTGTYHIGSGVAQSLSSIARMAVEVAGSTTAVTVQGPGNSFCLDIHRARQQLGLTPTPMAVALARFLPYVADDLKQERP